MAEPKPKAPKSKYTIRKYLGDDRYSWAMFYEGRPVFTGMDRVEARFQLSKARQREAERGGQLG